MLLCPSEIVPPLMSPTSFPTGHKRVCGCIFLSDTVTIFQGLWRKRDWKAGNECVYRQISSGKRETASPPCWGDCPYIHWHCAWLSLKEGSSMPRGFDNSMQFGANAILSRSSSVLISKGTEVTGITWALVECTTTVTKSSAVWVLLQKAVYPCSELAKLYML